ncbi:MAG: hypothetical protein DRG33_00925 [Deltaproteobacteria bacterium]|nr:MAG: hypothetical protein DRG33_00925 [Deltaproteobacteria bacterium]
MNAIKLLTTNKIPTGVIMVLSRANASKDKVPKLIESILWLKKQGIKSGRLNPMWTNNPLLKIYELTPEELAYAWIKVYEVVIRDKELIWQPYREMIDSLLGYNPAICIFNRCDYWNTQNCIVIYGDGTLGNCDRTYQEQWIYTRANANETNIIGNSTYERYYMLKETDCKGCRYFNICGGGCPAEGIDGDWRRKTRFCYAYKKLWERIESDIKGMFPNILLVTDFPDIDYYEAREQGKYINPFWAMSFYSSRNPSSWKGSYYPIRDKIINIENKEFTSHADFTNKV